MLVRRYKECELDKARFGRTSPHGSRATTERNSPGPFFDRIDLANYWGRTDGGSKPLNRSVDGDDTLFQSEMASWGHHVRSLGAFVSRIRTIMSAPSSRPLIDGSLFFVSALACSRQAAPGVGHRHSSVCRTRSAYRSVVYRLSPRPRTKYERRRKWPILGQNMVRLGGPTVTEGSQKKMHASPQRPTPIGPDAEIPRRQNGRRLESGSTGL